jgi:hypothetical protein
MEQISPCPKYRNDSLKKSKLCCKAGCRSCLSLYCSSCEQLPDRANSKLCNACQVKKLLLVQFVLYSSNLIFYCYSWRKVAKYLRSSDAIDIDCVDINVKGSTLIRLKHYLQLWSCLYRKEVSEASVWASLSCTGRTNERGLFPKRFWNCYMHVVHFHALDLLKKHPTHSIGNHTYYLHFLNLLGLHQQQSFESNNSLLKYQTIYSTL